MTLNEMLIKDLPEIYAFAIEYLGGGKRRGKDKDKDKEHLEETPSVEDRAYEYVHIACERILKQRDRFEREPLDIVPYAKTIIKHLHIDHHRAYMRHATASGFDDDNRNLGYDGDPDLPRLWQPDDDSPRRKWWRKKDSRSDWDLIRNFPRSIAKDESYKEQTDAPRREMESAVTFGEIRLRMKESLSKECWDILKQRAHGYKYAEIAKNLGINENSVPSKLFRCRMQFKEIRDDFA